MMDFKVSGRKTTVTDALRSYVDEKIKSALKVFDIQPMNCDVVLRVEHNPSNPQNQACEVTVHVRDTVVRVVASATSMYAAIDEAAEKVSRQLRKYKTKIVDRRHRSEAPPLQPATQDLADLLDDNGDGDDELIREKHIELTPMSEESALVQTDLIGHDFYVFLNEMTGLINVIYHRKNGGYGIIKPSFGEDNE